MRIDVVGLPASGKSTIAEKIAQKLSIPHIHLDQFWFASGGQQGRHDTPNIDDVRQKVRKKVLEAITADAWVSDGIYLHVQDEIAPRADVIVFLNIPLWKRLLFHAKRTFFERKRHAHLTLSDDISFFWEMVRREFSSKPKLLKFISAYENKTIVLKSVKEIADYLNKL